MEIRDVKRNQEEFFHFKENQMDAKHSAPFVHRVLREEETLDVPAKAETIEANYNKKELLQAGKY